MEMAAVNSPAAAFVAGLITSLHCVGMCGPLACALMPVRRDQGDPMAVSSVYHLSRLAGYAVLGGLAGGLGQAPLNWLGNDVLRWLPWVLVFFFVALASLTVWGTSSRFSFITVTSAVSSAIPVPCLGAKEASAIASAAASLTPSPIMATKPSPLSASTIYTFSSGRVYE